MNLRDFFRPAPSAQVKTLRDAMKGPDRDRIVILDVRQPEENQRDRIPGSILIPLGALPKRMNELDKTRPTYVYCRSGNRSAAAVGLLAGAGFAQVYNVEGGMFAWDGLVATGAIGSQMIFLQPGAPFDQVVAAAWAMEEGSAGFYKFVVENVKAGKSKAIFEELATAEKAHMDAIRAIYIALSSDDIAQATAQYHGEGCCMEGGVKLSDAIKWAKTASVDDILEFSMGIEANSYDLYTKLARDAKDQKTIAFFKALAEEEWRHLEKMTARLGLDL